MRFEPRATESASLIMPPKEKANSDKQVLNLLKSILPKAVTDPKLIDKIYSACEKEISAKNRVASFEKFCSKTELPDLSKSTVNEVKKQFEESFGKGKVNVVPHPDKNAATVEVILENESFEGTIKVGANTGAEEGEEEFKPKFVPFPVALPGDPELVWILARGETFPPEEAAIALQKVEEDFWATKSGQKLIRDRVERSFPEFILRVPGKMLMEAGLKRHYKEPEAIKQLKPAVTTTKHSKPAK